MKTIRKIDLIFQYTVEIDHDNPSVREYATDKELIDYLALNQFDVMLPLFGNGVNVKDFDFIDVVKVT